MPVTLKSLLSRPGVLLRIAGAHDALGATLVESAGFEGVWASSLEVSTACGRPDDDAVTSRCVLPAARSMASATRLPVIVDGGTGGRTATEVARLVRRCEAAKIAAICLEDAECPKRNSLLPGRHDLAPAREFAHKIDAATRTQGNPHFVVMARVEALIAGAGLQEALWRAREYVSAGADAIVIHSKSDTPDEVLAFIETWDERVPLVLIPTTYYTLTVRDVLRTKKVRMVIYANQGMRASIRATKEVLQKILDDGTTQNVENYVAPLQEIFGLQEDFTRRVSLQATVIATRTPARQ